MKKNPAVRTQYIEDLPLSDPDFFHLGHMKEWSRAWGTEADNGYEASARSRLGLLAEHLRGGLPVPPEEFTRLCDSLEAIAAGDDPSIVLGLKKTRTGAKPKLDRVKRLEQIAHRVWQYHRAGHPLNPNNEDEGALALAAELHKIAGAEARLAWEVWGKAYRELERTGKLGLPDLKPLRRGSS